MTSITNKFFFHLYKYSSSSVIHLTWISFLIWWTTGTPRNAGPSLLPSSASSSSGSLLSCGRRWRRSTRSDSSITWATSGTWCQCYKTFFTPTMTLRINAQVCLSLGQHFQLGQIFACKARDQPVQHCHIFVVTLCFLHTYPQILDKAGFIFLCCQWWRKKV